MLMIETQDLSKKFGEFVAVNRINLRVKKGTIHGFVGPNGAGKTTTMKMLVGAIKPSSGKAFIKGFEIGSIEARRIFGYSPENPKFYGSMSAYRYLVYMARVCGISRDDSGERARQLLEWLELKEFADKKIENFSAGMRQRLSLAQAMIHEPELLILDEPTANLDPAGRVSIINKLKELCKEKEITVFISSHILSELERMIDFVTIISHGQIIVESDIRTLKKKFAGKKYVLKTNKNALILRELKSRGLVSQAWMDDKGNIHLIALGDEELFRKKVTELILKCNASLEKFMLETSDLESVFMKLVGKDEERNEVNEEKEEKKHGWLSFFRRRGT